jgi:hypothetical protein
MKPKLTTEQKERYIKIFQSLVALIISEFNYKSSAKLKFDEILEFTRKLNGKDFLNNLQTYNYTLENGLLEW